MGTVKVRGGKSMSSMYTEALQITLNGCSLHQKPSLSVWSQSDDILAKSPEETVVGHKTRLIKPLSLAASIEIS